MSDKLSRKLIFNPEGDSSIESRKIIGGNPTNIIELNNIKYKWAYDLYKQMAMSNFWIPEEINMLEDKMQYEKGLSEAEKRAYELTLSFLIALDSFQVDVLKDFGRMFTAPELEMAITAQEYQESVHAYSYQYILESVTDPEKVKEIYEYWRQDEKLKNRNLVIAELYNEFIQNPTKENFLKAVIGDYILESLYFYSGFALFYTLGRQDKMTNTVQQIKLINRDELCFLPGTKVLTDNGFIPFEELEEFEKGHISVVQFNQYDENLSLAPEFYYIKKNWNGFIYHLEDKDTGEIISMTEGHEVLLYDTEEAKYIKMKVEEIPIGNPRYAVPVTNLSNLKHDDASNDDIYSIVEYHIVSDLFRKIGMITFDLDIPLEVERMKFLINICEDLGLNYEIVNGDSVAVLHIMEEPVSSYFPVPEVLLDPYYSSCLFDYLVYILGKNIKLGAKTQFEIYIDHLPILEQYAFLAGYYLEKIYDDSSYVKITVDKIREFKSLDNFRLIKDHYNGEVYCVSVSDSNIVVQSEAGGLTIVTGNCHVSLFRNIINSLKEEEPELFTPELEKWVYEYFKYAVDKEVDWGIYVTQNKILGLTDILIERYIKYLANMRLQQIGFKPIFEDVKEHPMSWIDEFRKINNAKSDFFQKRPIAYSKANELKW